MRHKIVLAAALTTGLLLTACQGEPTAPATPTGGALSPATHTTVSWKGYDWNVSDAGTATVDGSGNLVVTRTGAGDAGVQIASFPDPINAHGTPWMLFSYVDDGTAYQGYDLFVDYGKSTARISAGSLFSCDGLGYERFGVPAQEDFLFAVGCAAGLPRTGGEHTVYVGQRADGTIDAVFDGTWWKGDFLKQNGAAPFDFAQVFLRVRGGSAGDHFTFTDFRAGDNHPGGGNAAACKKGGWAASGLWKNQGRCVQYANTGDRKSSEISGN